MFCIHSLVTRFVEGVCLMGDVWRQRHFANFFQHVMHSERYHVPSETVEAVTQAKASGGRVVAVGTTSMRTLEAASSSGVLCAQQAETQIFIKPGYEFKTVDRLLTNFHLPKSTLMMLVAAFAGRENMVNAYRHAVAHRYRFFSYGDAMLIEKNWATPDTHPD